MTITGKHIQQKQLSPRTLQLLIFCLSHVCHLARAKKAVEETAREAGQFISR